MSKRKVYFRADASAEIGYGHFIRTLALADILKDDFDCTFFTQSPSEYQQQECRNVCRLISLPADDSRFDIFLEYLEGKEIVVLDNYYYSSEYQKKIKDKGCKLIHIDDVHDRHFYADVIINHGYALKSQYDTEKYTRFCLGASYALLRKPFYNQNTSFKRQVGRWIVCFGGSDKYNITERALKSLCNRSDVTQIIAIVGDMYKYASNLNDDAKVTVLSNLSADDMYIQYSTAEYIVCSASSVCYEALACGCKVLAGYYVDNQKDFYLGLLETNLIHPIGNLISTDFDKCLSHTDTAISKINIQHARLNLLNVFKTIDFRVINYIDLTIEQNRVVWMTRNLQEIRACMSNDAPFSFETHLAFIESLKENTSKLYFAVYRGDDFIGSYDFIDIKDGNSAEHGLYINPSFHNKGYGTLIENMMDEYIKERGVSRIIAEVLKTNTQSYSYHLKLGYKVYCEDERFFYFERYL